MFGKSDPYLEFSKENSDGSYTVVHRTEVRITKIIIIRKMLIFINYKRLFLF